MSYHSHPPPSSATAGVISRPTGVGYVSHAADLPRGIMSRPGAGMHPREVQDRQQEAHYHW